MRCDSGRMKTKSMCRFGLLCIWTLASPAAVLAQSPVCYSIRSGETATQLARRITGDGRNMYQPWFQIVDRLSRSVPKSQYDRVRPGWRACIAREAKEPGESSVQPVVPPDTSDAPGVPGGNLPPMVADTIRPAEGVDLTLAWVGAALVLPLFAWKIADDYAARRKTSLIVMRHYAHRFVREFERPLIHAPTEPPLRARLRLRPARRRMDILLAPGAGRRYPNLSDHKKNMEYDVARIVRLLADDSFVRDPLYMHADWVVVPFRFNAAHKHTGVS